MIDGDDHDDDVEENIKRNHVHTKGDLPHSVRLFPCTIALSDARIELTNAGRCMYLRTREFRGEHTTVNMPLSLVMPKLSPPKAGILSGVHCIMKRSMTGIPFRDSGIPLLYFIQSDRYVWGRKP